MNLPVLQLKCGTSGNAVPTLLLKYGTAGDAVPTLLRACPSGEIVPPVTCTPCGVTAPAWIYVTMTVPGGYQQLCLPDINGNCTDFACVKIWSTGERVKLTSAVLPGQQCYYESFTAGISHSINRATAANCDLWYDGENGVWVDPCDHTDATLVSVEMVQLFWDSDASSWKLYFYTLANQAGNNDGMFQGLISIPQCTTGIYTFVVNYKIAFQGDPNRCEAGPIPITVTIEFPEVG